VDLSRQTMCDWMRQSAELASPLYELMKQRTLSSKVVQTDDTPVPVLDPWETRTLIEVAEPYRIIGGEARNSSEGHDSPTATSATDLRERSLLAAISMMVCSPAPFSASSVISVWRIVQPDRPSG